MQDVREETRRAKTIRYTLSWRGRDGAMCATEARGLDISSSGVGVECGREIPVDVVVQIKAADGSVVGECVVAHCTRRGLKFHVGLELSDRTRTQTKANARKPNAEPDYYDVLQISQNADMETVHRVFRIMATRFHPDNPQTGDPEEFLRLKKAYDILSNPEKRAEYDAVREASQTDTMPIFELRDFVTGVEAESNRRLGVASLLYNQRRQDPDHPQISLLELENRMGFPREYLTFTMWYLRCKEYVSMADNSDFVLTASGVDFVESNAGESDIVAKLLKAGTPMKTHTTAAPSQANGRQEAQSRPDQRYLPEPAVRVDRPT